MPLDSIKNTVIFPNGIASSGQPLAEQFADIRAAGYEVLINLALPDSDDALANEGALVASLGMTYVHLPVPFDRPRVEHLIEFSRLMQAYRRRKCWVHCVVNYRVSAFLYLYLTQVAGWPEHEARSPMFEQWQPNATWERFLSIRLAPDSVFDRP